MALMSQELYAGRTRGWDMLPGRIQARTSSTPTAGSRSPGPRRRRTTTSTWPCPPRGSTTRPRSGSRSRCACGVLAATPAASTIWSPGTASPAGSPGPDPRWTRTAPLLVDLNVRHTAKGPRLDVGLEVVAACAVVAATPTLGRAKSPRRIRAYVWAMLMLSFSATCLQVRKRAGMGMRLGGGYTAVTCASRPSRGM
jgi:hypothetical protein